MPTPTDTSNHYRGTDGRFQKWTPCDCCGKPVNTLGDFVTDSDVCGDGNDGPGFFLCLRVRCTNRRNKISAIEDRRDLFTRQRAENRAAQKEDRKPRRIEA